MLEMVVCESGGH